MIQKIKTFIPKYAFFPIVGLFAFNSFVYFVTKLCYSPDRAFDLSLGIDKQLPFVPFFIVIYILAYVQWAIGYIIISREDSAYFGKVATANILAKIFCGICFILLPTAMVRAEVNGSGILEWLTNFIYAADTPAVNLFPSIHCLESWAVFRCSLKLKIHVAYKIIMGIFTLLVFASVLLVKQHIALDIPAGILVFELGYLITHLTKLDVKIKRLFSKKT